MSDLDPVRYRRAQSSDAPAIAALHADSWRHHYRGAYSDTFLDGDVAADRLEVWTRRLEELATPTNTIVAEADSVIVGFAHTILDEDPKWGTLLENLHVAHDWKCRGVGTQLVATGVQDLLERRAVAGLYLWVLEQNTAAQAFYEARGGTCVERSFAPPPGGEPRRLVGAPRRLRYVWPDPSELLLWRRL